MTHQNQPKFYLIAGESSGDYIGAQLIKSLKQQVPNCMVYGIGGPLMMAEGLCSLFPMKELSIMGITEVIPKIFHLLKRIRQTANDIITINPDVVITIDAPDFCHRVTKIVKKNVTTIPVIHYVAPTVWAWRAGRAKKLAKLIDHLLTLFPFEPPYFTVHGLKTTFVGHPLLEHPALLTNADLKNNSILILPGSRVTEINNLLPIFLKAAEILYRKDNTRQFVLPIFEHHRFIIQQYLQSNTLPIRIIDQTEKWQAFHQARGAIAASGTVALELALTNTPMVVAYKVSKLTYYIVRRLIKTPYASLPNILLNEKIVPELLQNDCEPQKIADVFERLLNSTDVPMKLAQVKEKLENTDKVLPSEYATQIVLSYCS